MIIQLIKLGPCVTYLISQPLENIQQVIYFFSQIWRMLSTELVFDGVPVAAAAGHHAGDGPRFELRHLGYLHFSIDRSEHPLLL